MSRKFQDENFLVWEVYPSASRFGFSEGPLIIFNCLTDRQIRARYVDHTGNEAAAERTVATASTQALRELLRTSRDVP